MSDGDANASHRQVGRAGEDAAFPYVVIRHFPAVYEQRSVRLIADPSFTEEPDTVFLVRLPTATDEVLGEDRRLFIVSSLLDFSRTADKRTCAVFGPEDAIYIEPSGETRASSDIPRSESHWGMI
ncbi:MAG TPA: hypothetical protein VGR26_12725 [Acidimicrobiales bacterium]|nr:hypothetical protein [Acidimicrobiales bacterium]